MRHTKLLLLQACIVFVATSVKYRMYTAIRAAQLCKLCHTTVHERFRLEASPPLQAESCAPGMMAGRHACCILMVMKSTVGHQLFLRLASPQKITLALQEVELKVLRWLHEEEATGVQYLEVPLLCLTAALAFGAPSTYSASIGHQKEEETVLINCLKESLPAFQNRMRNVF